MASLLAKAKEVRERLYPVLKESAFVDRGVLTPQEFVAAGDELVGKYGMWQWATGDENRKKNYLPSEKQFLITNNVPCRERAAAIEHVTGYDGDTDDWVAPSVPESSESAPREIPTRDDDEDLGDDDATVDNILRTRTYDLTITYDKYWQTPRMWFYGYDENGQPLSQQDVFQDIVLDYAQRTVTFETHPHLAHPHASIHPCKHPAAMKRIIDQMKAPPRPDQALFLFLKFIQAVVPTIEYDDTGDALVS